MIDAVEYFIYGGILAVIVGLVAWNELIAKPRDERERRKIEAERAQHLAEWLKR